MLLRMISSSMSSSRKKALAIYGPTASGKSELSDLAGDLLSESIGCYSPVIVVDSMQVYKEIPVITNQHRRRPAELTGVVSVSEEWTMSRHRQACDEVTEDSEGSNSPFVLDAGTGMYLNAILLDIPIAPRVTEDVRRMAEAGSRGAANPRRSSRELELKLSGFQHERGSIWGGTLRYDLDVLYLRPDRATLDSLIEDRSRKITRNGLEEATALSEAYPRGIPNHSVRDSIGIKELISYAKGKLSLEDAEQQIQIRTRRLARRQTRWFDKLTQTLEKSPEGMVATQILEHPQDLEAPILEYTRKVQELYA